MPEIITHKAISFTKTLCGTPTNIVNVRWTNDVTQVDCPDCLKIMEIQTRNEVNNVNEED